MTVDELRAALDGLPGDMPVVMASDAEGNSHSPLSDATITMYMADSAWSGDVYMTPEERTSKGAAAEDYLAAPDDAVRALLLEPVN